MDLHFPTQLSPQGHARELLYHLGINSIPVDPFAICDGLGIEVYFEPLDAQAYLLKNNSKTRILLNSHCEYDSKERFTLAHELGHYTMPHHTQKTYRCSKSDIGSFRSDKIAEREADDFAAELIMPSVFFDRDVDKLSPSIESFKSLSAKYCSSLTATAINFIKKTIEPAALIMSQNKKILWFFRSPSFNYTIRYGDLSSYTEAYHYFCSSFIPHEPCKVFSHAWLTNCNHDFIVEDSMAFTNLNAVLTVLTIPIDEDHDYEDYDFD